MEQTVRIGLVGDHNPAVRAHRSIPLALALAGTAAGCRVEPVWIATPDAATRPEAELAAFDALWCVPASPYASMDGALRAIRLARERGIPFLGTCGGFQHTLIEYARDVRGLAAADHAESNPEAVLPLITPLACSLAGVEGEIRFLPGSRIRAIYGQDSAVERFQCNFGLNPQYGALFESGDLRITGVDANGEARVVELAGHPFFLATLFQPEQSGLAGRTHPLIVAYVQAALASDRGTRNALERADRRGQRRPGP